MFGKFAANLRLNRKPLPRGIFKNGFILVTEKTLFLRQSTIFSTKIPNNWERGAKTMNILHIDGSPRGKA
jgi:hypothetical protein